MLRIGKIRRLETQPYRGAGFTLVELLMTMLVLGILLSIAIPGYKDYMIRANKSAVKAAMLEIASRQEQYVVISGTYGTLVQLGYSVPTAVSAVFDIQLTPGTNSGSTVTALQGLPTFTLTASGKANTIQAGHPAAGAATQLSINQFGLKLPLNEW
jgi:type IV pilus assembly protein PilE